MQLLSINIFLSKKVNIEENHAEHVDSDWRSWRRIRLISLKS